ncbi:MAG: S41 family peptidase [Bryobacteraceae bacterium]
MTTAVERTAILDNIQKLVRHKLFHPSWSATDIADRAAALENLRAELIHASEEQFEQRLNVWLCGFGLSHMAFFHAPQFAIGAELRAFPNGNDYAWFVQHVAEGGVAQKADEPRFHLGEAHQILVQRQNETDARAVMLNIPKASEKDRPPMVTSEPLSHEILEKRIGLMRVATFPGAVGFDFARGVDHIMARFKAAGCDRLIVDLRGNPSGGLGSLRLMSYLVPDRRLTGYSLTRKGKEHRKSPEKLMRIGHIPKTKLGLWTMAFRFGLLHRDRSLSLWTEGSGAQPFHGKTILLVLRAGKDVQLERTVSEVLAL